MYPVTNMTFQVRHEPRPVYIYIYIYIYIYLISTCICIYSHHAERENIPPLGLRV